MYALKNIKHTVHTSSTLTSAGSCVNFVPPVAAEGKMKSRILVVSQD